MKKFIASYSGGKDSILAIDRAIRLGYQPVALLITVDKDKEKSWFHGLSLDLLKKVEKSINIPIWTIHSSGDDYRELLLEALIKGRQAGAEVVIYGDIDIIDHYAWCDALATEAGLASLFPLWGEDRRSLVNEFINRGFKALITVVDTKRLEISFAGHLLDPRICKELEAAGVDICGEEGEFHTFCFAGPLFTSEVALVIGEKIMIEDYCLQLIE